MSLVDSQSYKNHGVTQEAAVSQAASKKEK
jgi:hypothetical protein